MSVLVATSDGLPRASRRRGTHVTLARGSRASTRSRPDRTAPWLAIVDGHEVWQHGADGDVDAAARRRTSTLSVDRTLHGATVFVGHLRRAAAAPRHDGGRARAGRRRSTPAPGATSGTPVGPPLNVRSMTSTADGGALLANVHVGGILRSTDGGAIVGADPRRRRRRPPGARAPDATRRSWSRPRPSGCAAAPTAARRGRSTPTACRTPYARAVAFTGDDVLVSVSDGPFARPVGRCTRARSTAARSTRVEQRPARRRPRRQRRHRVPRRATATASRSPTAAATCGSRDGDDVMGAHRRRRSATSGRWRSPDRASPVRACATQLRCSGMTRPGTGHA